MTPPVVLSIAGSDSSGGAGVQADLRVFGALGVLGATALTCITAQNTKEVREVYPLPPAVVRAQVQAVVDDIELAAAKTGLLGSELVVREVAALAPKLPPIVVDPVLAASSGRSFADDATVRAYRDLLFPLAEVVTPNLEEAAALLGQPLSSLEDAEEAARKLGESTKFVVVKGGHLADQAKCTDVVWDGQRCWRLPQPRVPSRNTHGGGCSFSAAIAAGLARGLDTMAAVKLANQFVHDAIEGSASWRIGAGQGPLDHFAWRERKWLQQCQI